MHWSTAGDIINIIVINLAFPVCTIKLWPLGFPKGKKNSVSQRRKKKNKKKKSKLYSSCDYYTGLWSLIFCVNTIYCFPGQ